VGGDNQITSTWLVILVITFFSYAVASGFMMVFDISIDSVLICYVVVRACPAFQPRLR